MCLCPPPWPYTPCMCAPLTLTLTLALQGAAPLPAAQRNTTCAATTVDLHVAQHSHSRATALPAVRASALQYVSMLDLLYYDITCVAPYTGTGTVLSESFCAFLCAARVLLLAEKWLPRQGQRLCRQEQAAACGVLC